MPRATPLTGHTFIVLAALCCGLLFLERSSDSVADDCEWSKSQMTTYLAACAGVDGCSLKDRYQQIILQTCGPSASVAPATSSRSPEPPPSSSAPANTISYASSTHTSNQKPADRDDYTGQSCVYFTKPAVEVKDGVVRHNTYANDAMVCYKDALYRCVSGKWRKLRDCPGSVGYEKLQAEVLEGSEN